MPRFACLLVLATALAAADAALTAKAEAYQKNAAAIVDSINAGKVDKDDVEARILICIDAAIPMARAYVAKHPAGTQAIDQTIAALAVVDGSGKIVGFGPMADLTFTEIEEQWHDLKHFDGGKAGIDFSDEDQEHFTDPLHTMIHPIMVLRAIRDYAATQNEASLQAAKAEMQEGIEQCEKTLKSL